MRGLRKLIACALVAVITIGVLASCGETQTPPEAEGDGSDEEQAAEPHLSYDAQIPVIDGSVSAEALADAFYGSLEGGAAGLHVSFSGTDPAMEKLSEGSVDAALIAAGPRRYAALKGAYGSDIEFIELAKDAVVLLAGSSNMVSDLSLEQAAGIFNGDITNWKDVGGADVSIRLIQRSESSELRELLEDLLLGGEDSAGGAKTPVCSDDGAIGECLAPYDASPDQIAYASLFQAEGEWNDSRILSVEGVQPGDLSVASGTYPLSYSYYLAYRRGDAGFSGSSLLSAYMRSDFVQSLIEETGYVPLTAADDDASAKPGDPEAASDAGGAEASDEPAPAPQLPPSSNSSGPSYAFTKAAANAVSFETEYRGGRKTSANTYISLSGLADGELQDALNARLEAISDEIYDSQELPPYRGIPDAGELYSHSYDRSSSIEALWNAGDIVSFRIDSLDEFEDGEISVRRVSGLTADLKTGAELRLADIFGQSYDYASVIDAEVRRYIRSESLGSADPNARVRLVSPYGGVREDQSFYLSSDGLNIVFDWNDECFDFRSGSSWEPLVITLGYDLFDGGIICGRDSDASVYSEDRGSIAVLPGRNGSGTATELIDHYGGDSDAISMKSVYVYPKSFPRKIIARVKEDALAFMPQIPYWEQYVEDNESPEGTVDIFALARFSCDGQYYSADLSVKSSLPENDHAERRVYSLYGQDLEPVELSALFREGADYRSVIEAAVEEALSEELASLEYLVEGETAEDIAEGLSFRLSSDSMLFASEPLRISRRSRSYIREAQLVFEIPLEDFGDGAFVFSPVRSAL